MPNRWVEFVKDFAARNNISYGCAITNTDCRVEYGIIKAGSMPKLTKPKNPKMIIENEGETTPVYGELKLKKPKKLIIEDDEETTPVLGEIIDFGVSPRSVYQSPRQSLPMAMPYKEPVYKDLLDFVPSEFPLIIQTNPVKQLSNLYDFKMPREERQIPLFNILMINGKKYLAFEKDYNDVNKKTIKIFDYEKGKEGYVVKVGKYLKDIGDVLLDE